MIIGAGVSGIGAAYRITERNPGTRYVILERRTESAAPGTCSAIRESARTAASSPVVPLGAVDAPRGRGRRRPHSGIPGTRPSATASTSIRFDTHVRSADWDSATDTWTVHTTDTASGAQRSYRGRFVFFGSGYYNYDEGYTPDFPGIEDFGGAVVHPQFWPPDLDYGGKKVVVIGSGATAILAHTRTRRHRIPSHDAAAFPTYLLSAARVNPFLQIVRKLSPRRISIRSHGRTRRCSKPSSGSSRGPHLLSPKASSASRTPALLPPGYPVHEHFNPLLTTPGISGSAW